MYNILLDRLPIDYEGYLINTDFRVGIQIIQALQDKELNYQESLIVAFNLLYGKGIPDYEMAYKGLIWYLNGGNPPEIKENDEENKEEPEKHDKVLDYDYDSKLIFSAFKRTYDIDLKTAKMHWFEFQSLMNDLGESALINIVDIRQKKIDRNMTAREKQMYYELKEKYGLPQEEDEETDDFVKRMQEKERGI